MPLRIAAWLRAPLIAGIALVVPFSAALAQNSARPILHGQHWMAITGKPLAATAGAQTFERGGNAVDAAAPMLAATATMWDTLGWGYRNYNRPFPRIPGVSGAVSA